MNKRNGRFQAWIKSQRKYKNLQKRLYETQGKSLDSKVLRKLDLLKRRILAMNRKWRLGIATSLLLGWMAATSKNVQAQNFPAQLDLSTLDGSNGFSIRGQDIIDRAGSDVSNAGDINGDGIDDIIIGAPLASADGRGKNGQSYVVFGSGDGFDSQLNLSQLDGSNGFAINGVASGDYSGGTVSSAGDINGDGIDDLLVKGFSRYNTPYDYIYSAGVNVIFGKNTGFPSRIKLSQLDGTNGFTIRGILNAALTEIALSNAGDINSDGIDDIIIGTPEGGTGGLYSTGQSYVLFGNTNGFPSKFNVLEDLDGSNGFIINGANSEDAFGSSVSNAGDVNGDGIDDVIIGARSLPANGILRSGGAYVVFGKTDPFVSPMDAKDINGTNGFVINGIAGQDVTGSGTAVSSAGDINNDGVEDIMISTRKSEIVYVVYGNNAGFSPQLDLSDINGTNGFKLTGAEFKSSATQHLSKAGDINGDSIDDIIIGSMYSQNGDGKSYVLFGNSSGLPDSTNLNNLNGGDGFIINGKNTRDNFGASVSLAGDINNDGLDDIIIGAPRGAVQRGEAFVIFGRLQENFSPTVVSPLNDLPLIAGFGSQNIDLSNTFEDLDGETLTLSVSSDNDSIVTADIIGNNLTITEVGIGSTNITVTADDGNGGSVSETFLLTIETLFPVEFSVSDLDSTSILIINGANSRDFSGGSISDIGDVNNDGVDDILIGADFATANGKSHAGQSYVVFGSSSGFNAELNLSELDGTNGFTLNGINEYQYSGRVVSGAGDVNGDGIDDFMVKGFRKKLVSSSYSGGINVIFGSDSGFPSQLQLSQLDGTNGFTIRGIAGDIFFDMPMSNAGDVNGDGIEDIVLGAQGANYDAISGESYVLFGTSNGFPSKFNVSELNGVNGFVINEFGMNDSVGISVSNAGDINADGIDDIIMGGYGSKFSPPRSPGESYVIFGSASGFVPSFDLQNLDGTNGFVIKGVAFLDRSGRTVSSAGDFNGDNIDDVILEARETGEAYILFGNSSGFGQEFDLNTINGINGIKLTGIEATFFSGPLVSDAGDINGDGFDDVIIGSEYSTENNYAGKGYVVFGNSQTTVSTLHLPDLDGINGFIVNGATSDDRLGGSISSAGDINNDGIDDLMLSTRFASSDGLSNNGRTYVIFGRSSGLMPLNVEKNTTNISVKEKVSSRANETTSISENAFENLKAYPNPTNGQLNIDLGQTFNGQLSVMDLMGNLVIKRTFSKEQKVDLDLSNQSDGVYFVLIESNEAGKKMFKIVKQ